MDSYTEQTEYGLDRAVNTNDRYEWLGGAQRASDTVADIVLMGVRLYNPTAGRFLQVDPVIGGNANAYDYCNGDPINCRDLDGRWSIGGLFKEIKIKAIGRAVELVIALACGVTFSFLGAVLCAGLAVGAKDAVIEYMTNGWNATKVWKAFLHGFVTGVVEEVVGKLFKALITLAKLVKNGTAKQVIQWLATKVKTIGSAGKHHRGNLFWDY
ncbi:RHS repeat-associated core domain-containing protein [Microbispora sp. NBC_01389]|uniref:RHS repeat-associated core domain-containing protein n=1 Tax=Microbispora sp. NBC_01389 TaxID=2903584 RepID=UPI003250785A